MSMHTHHCLACDDDWACSNPCGHPKVVECRSCEAGRLAAQRPLIGANQCEHGQLARSCERCWDAAAIKEHEAANARLARRIVDTDAKVERLTARVAVLEEALNRLDGCIHACDREHGVARTILNGVLARAALDGGRAP